MRKIIVLLMLCGYSHLYAAKTTRLTSVHVVDRHGLSETINSKQRVQAFEKNDFLSPQPYEKVTRIFSRNKEGKIPSILTSYHPNGYIKQYLQAQDNRAYGDYIQWHNNGIKKLQCRVIGGIADLTETAEHTWLFEGTSYVWDEEGNLIAEIQYDHGNLEGEALYYHTNGTLWKMIPFSKDLEEGVAQVFSEEGTLLEETNFKAGMLDGISHRYWDKNSICYEELYRDDKLLEASYFSYEGRLIASIHDGCGFKATFNQNTLESLQQYIDGVQQGQVRLFNEQGVVAQTFHTLNGEKEGEEIIYTIRNVTHQPKLSMTWSQGNLHGPVKTWYESGTLSSQTEYSQNLKLGLSIAWYEDGSLMLLEEYDRDELLLRGEYYKKGEHAPCSRVEKGEGIATLFSPTGIMLKKIEYHQGKPIFS